jgi:hypothetical protein
MTNSLRITLFLVFLLTGCAPKWTVKKDVQWDGNRSTTKILLCDPYGPCYEVHRSSRGE